MQAEVKVLKEIGPEWSWLILGKLIGDAAGGAGCFREAESGCTF